MRILFIFLTSLCPFVSIDGILLIIRKLTHGFLFQFVTFG